MEELMQTLYAAPDNPLYTVSRDPKDGRFCLWYGDEYRLDRRTLEEAMDEAKRYAAADPNDEETRAKNRREGRY